jgi:Xaa-Pro aminopeptidase
MTRLLLGPLLLVALAAGPARASRRPAIDLDAAQAILAVQSLDGWLLAESSGQNPIAVDLVRPGGGATRQWFYFIPAQGAPVALVHRSEVAAFEDVPGKKIEYTGARDLRAGLRTMLKGAKKIAMEYAPRSGIPSLTRVDAATISLVRGVGARISSSAELVQFTKSLWGPDGRVAHYVAMHHLARLKDAALAHLRAELRAGSTVTERDLQQFIQRGYEVRGIDGPPPVVAAGANTADPQYVPSATRGVPIRQGDLVLIDLSARVTDAERPIFARLAWVAYVGKTVPERPAALFATVAQARDAAVELIGERAARRRVVKGFEVDQRARAVIAKADLGDRFLHRTGHSLDTSLVGDGAHLDDHEAHDTRNLVMGSGFTVGPGVYVQGELGVRSVIDVYMGRRGPEVTGPVQSAITAVLAP